MAKWQPLERAEPIYSEKQIAALVRDSRKLHRGPEPFDEEEIRRLIEAERRWPIYKNWLYQVAVARREQTDLPRMTGDPAAPVWLVHLSIKQLDRRPARDWRHLQLIKNQLLGEECEAVELFPAESRLVDIANQTHLWGLDDPYYRFPVGFDQGRQVSDDVDPESDARQRRFG